ncbi:MAG: PD40 domain-containing protein [Fimbriimonadaceae bacterium]|nr:PD40 domain-containing protein [Fimbriimonadaceae bacterium]
MAYLPAYDARAALLATNDPSVQDSAPITAHPSEKHLRNIRQLTFGGQNAEAYWNKSGTKLIFQTRQPGFPDEQIFTMNADGSDKRLVSTGEGRCTCSYFFPDGKHILFSSTHELNKGPQPPVDMSKGYFWMVNPQFRLYRARTDGSRLEKLLDRNGYIAEATVDPNGKFITFTGSFDGDLEIYRMDANGKNVRRLTNDPGYDGGPFVSWDGKKIVYRRDLIESDSELQEYKALLAQNLVRPSKLEIWIMDADGKNKRQLTNLGCASFAPFLHPDGKRVIFASNYGDARGREFDLYTIGVDGKNLERITFEGEFDGFPMFTRDGKRLVFASNRNGKVRGETNIFVADWVN